MTASGSSYANHLEPIEIQDDEDIGTRIARPLSCYIRHRRSSSPDPISSFQSGSSHHAHKHHAFSRPSSPESQPRAQTEDGEHTARLRERLKPQEQSVVVVDDSDPLEDDPITLFSDDDATQRAKTPSGKTVIPANNVKQKVQAFETQSLPPVPHIDLNAKLSVRRRMKGKAQNDVQVCLINPSKEVTPG